MYTVIATYSDRITRSREVKHVTKIKYKVASFEQEVIGDEILTHKFLASVPLTAFHKFKYIILGIILIVNTKIKIFSKRS